jgi:8-oxo-dGTP pyrophosphatase MutT (NUDIX family)
MVEEPDAPASLDAEQLATWADELRAMAAHGLMYGHDPYDLARYRRIQEIAEALLAGLSGLDAATVRAALAADLGYITVKVGVATAVLDGEGRLLLVQRRDNKLWAMPGGWADVGDTPAVMAAREVWEETGLHIRVERLLGLYDSRARRFGHPHHLYHVVFLGSPSGGTMQVSPETLGVDWFSAASLPPLSPGHAEPVRDAFLAWADPHSPAVFD